MPDDDLEKRVERLEGLVNALQAQNRRLRQAVAGGQDEFSNWDVEQMVPLHERVDGLEETVSDHAQKFEMFVVEEGSQSTPDQRAMHLRQVLLNQAQKNEAPLSKLTRSQADSSLGGDLHKDRVLDAMKRAANGHDADIGGSSDLQPIDGIQMEVGGTVGSDGSPEQSYLLLELGDLTGDQARQILTTGESGPGVAD